MRTTLQIDEDVLEAAKCLARAEGKTLGEVISRLARKGLAPDPQQSEDAGFPVFEVSEDARSFRLAVNELRVAGMTLPQVEFSSESPQAAAD